ncbi:hypothetical protein [Emticicia sp. W12TSBA100-4]|uniref:hypothetical protein n=1 Tax=Emticicia sp. W12TSBA100-4 TaxID=3160965 RepID=UPI0033058012
MYRLSLIAKRLNIGILQIVDILEKEGFYVEYNPNFKIDDIQLDKLCEVLAVNLADYTPENEEVKTKFIHVIRISKLFEHFKNVDYKFFVEHTIRLDENSRGIEGNAGYESIFTQEKAILKKLLLKLAKGFRFRLKIVITYLKYLFLTITPPNLFHTYIVDEDDINRVAINTFGFSIISIYQLREAVFHSINSKILIKNEIRFGGIN